MGRWTVNKYIQERKGKSITGMLYQRFKDKIDIFSSHDSFFYALSLPKDKEDALLSNRNRHPQIFLADYYGRIYDKIDWDAFRKKLAESIERSHCSKDDANKCLPEILSNADMYLYKGQNTNSWCADSFAKYDDSAKEKLALFYSIKQDNFDLTYNIYLLLYFAVTKSLPDNFYFGQNYHQQLREYEEQVTEKFGGSSTGPAIRAILRLTEGGTEKAPNIFALLDKADWYYYGKPECGIMKDIQKAYDLYEIAAGLEPAPFSDDHTICHPKALWSLSFILLNYHRKGYGLENCDPIRQIEERYGDNLLLRYERVIEYAVTADKYLNDKDGECANTLGKIALVSEEECPGITDLRKRSKMRSAEEYLSESAEKNYIYAINNLAMLENDKIFADPDNWKQHLNTSIEYLKRGCDLLDPWACNTLGLLYLTGEVQKRKYITFGPRVSTKYVRKREKDEAFKCFKKASNTFLDHNSGWAIRNLILNYPEYYTENSEELAHLMEQLPLTGNDAALAEVKDKFEELYGVPYQPI